MLVDDDPDALVERGRRRALPGRARRRSTATGTPSSAIAAALYACRAVSWSWDVAIVGAGYVGLPLAQTFAEAGKRVLLVDVVAGASSTALNRGESHIEDVPSETLAPLVERAAIARDDRLRRSSRDADAILIALPTPLSKQREPDLSIVECGRARHRAARCARASSSCSSRRPTRARRARCVQPILEEGSGLEGRRRTSTSPSRPSASTPAATDWTTKTTPKVVGGITPASHEPRGRRSTGSAVDTVARGLVARGGRADEAAREHLPLGQHRARQRARAALRPDGHRRLGGRRRRRDEAVRLHDASSPGPGLGGHCIPLDPFYLSWKAREYDFYTEFIELAGKVNENMPYFCRSRDLAGAEPRRAASR